jgi:hypothetical protein
MATNEETAVTKTQTIAAVTSLLLLLGASIWLFSGSTREIVVAPPSQGVQR